MTRRRRIAALITCALLSSGEFGTALAQTGDVALPAPQRGGAGSLADVLARRRSVREFAKGPLTLAAVSQLLWAAQGITGRDGQRTAPSAGALYPLELYLVAGAVTGLEVGVYRYQPKRHRLLLHMKGDPRGELADAALEQEWVAEAPGVLVICAVYRRSERKYGRRAPRYVHMEVGHAAQNVYLQAMALDLGTVMVGAFHDRQLARVLQLPEDVEPLGVMPIGKRRGD
ncbi:MAG: SagB/ThcOx family dehydrogenase [Deltaproteobacteria bacterium]|nr:SagB/ThcOx family dehydrogenase [Deltaproteobacteria bacterium]